MSVPCTQMLALAAHYCLAGITSGCSTLPRRHVHCYECQHSHPVCMGAALAGDAVAAGPHRCIAYLGLEGTEDGPGSPECVGIRTLGCCRGRSRDQQEEAQEKPLHATSSTMSRKRRGHTVLQC